MASLYAQYIKERTDKKIIENEFGFAVYSFTDDAVYIEDIFVIKEQRKSGIAAKMADDICAFAKAAGFKKALGSVVPSAYGSADSIKVLMAYDMKLKSAVNDFILFEKEI